MKIAVINATKVSIEPVDQAAKEYPDLEIFHFMDEGMSWLGKQEGRISGKNLSRMISLILSAEELGVDGILLSCTIFSPFIALTIFPGSFMLNTMSSMLLSMHMLVAVESITCRPLFSRSIYVR